MPALRTLDARALRPVHQAVGAHGAATLRTVGLSSATLQMDPRLPGARIDGLWQAAVDHSDPELPLRIAQTASPATYGHLTYLLAAAPTVGDALRCLCRHYGALLGDTTAHRLESSQHLVRLHIESFGPRPACVDLFSVAVVACFVERLAGTRPRRAFLGPWVTPELCRTAQAQLGCPTQSGVPTLGLEYTAADLNTALRTADPQLQGILEEHARWRGHAQSTVQLHVEAAIAVLGARAGLRSTDVASALGVSVRTLRRRLAAEQSSYQSVLDDALRRAALELLETRSVEDTAHVLGYADGSAFRRAHRRWLGSSPRGHSPVAAPMGLCYQPGPTEPQS
ncbi:MAG: AraC family transcriptional regulator ligand-binding domain-containing protein [Nannocystaceae bacterium]|nr:AraC family transcriptional regulator ligand-binding domain-containing protein [Nannocystaceae bacterium]